MVTANNDERAPLLPRHAKSSNGSTPSAPRLAVNHDDEDDLDFDARFRKWKAAVARKFRGKAHRDTKPSLLITQFDGVGQAQSVLDAKHASASRNTLHEATSMSSHEFQRQVEQVKHAIQQGVYPKMITTGSSGSYFVRIINNESAFSEGGAQQQQIPSLATVAVFKPKDEEPYGNLNPKRQFLRKYLWWAMGRPCLIPNFSYLSEVGASYLDARLALEMVPRTELVELSSPTFHYAYNDRIAFDKHHVPLPNKVGSYQTFLKGYVNASDFLRRHPWPSRTRSKTLLMRDMDDESRAHKVSRRKERARLRNCGTALKRLLLCRPSWGDLYANDEPDACHPNLASSSDSPQPDGFYWTPKRMEQFRLQLERLVVLDYLMRNTDRGLDNFMIRHDVDKDEIRIGAIDNSLSFPIKHPNEIRQYPFGWLFLPSDLIGLPFSAATREHLLPILNDPVWWQRTIRGLRHIFQQDAYFDEAKFERQMSVMRGQGWNLVQCLQAADEGPLDLCAREKKLIRQEVHELPVDKVAKMDGIRVALDPEGLVVPLADAPESPGASKPAVGTKPLMARTISTGIIETERRPIGMRASESYRKALLEAAGAGVTSDALSELEDAQRGEAYEPAAQGSVSSSLLQASTLRDTMHADVFADEAAADKAGVQRARHQRYASANDAGVFADVDASGSSRRVHADSVLGRTGIEVLEGLDRERKQQGRLKFFRTRKRSSTLSNSGAPTSSAQEPSTARRESSEGVSSETAYDLSSSIVSDPGVRVARWPRPRSASRPADSMHASLHDLHSPREVLSEEEEDDTQPHSTAVKSGCVPTIDSVLQRSNGKVSRQASGKAFVPHIPHPTSVGPARADDVGTAGKRTVKVVVEKISSDTKQAWLKWI
ncbi:related to LSB6-Phosphatidylinositol 4-kinase [Sporisorium reilianum SRZ2]|uniref:Phosphatidylinositol 4-kinase n=1 Tax=Sporisorium reilianum (strain SRZ2) TaxID=999809 RepID=E6ZZ70_SPORE|nr:related to LSB6-Phosphatidylinositol 4-kinase [Sporisorium reilianum SRZ2]